MAEVSPFITIERVPPGASALLEDALGPCGYGIEGEPVQGQIILDCSPVRSETYTVTVIGTEGGFFNTMNDVRPGDVIRLGRRFRFWDRLFGRIFE